MLQEWYGGGPEFQREIITNRDGKRCVELYPPILYAMPAALDGTPINTRITGCMVGNRWSMERVQELVRKKLGQEKGLSRLWYRMMSSSCWKLVTDLKMTVEDIGLLFGEKVMLEGQVQGSHHFSW